MLQSERLRLMDEARAAIAAARTADDLRDVWRRFFPTLGHRVLGRLLLDRTPEQATRSSAPSPLGAGIQGRRDSVAVAAPVAGAVIRTRGRLWRVDDVEGDTLTVTSIDGGEAEQTRLFAPVEEIERGQLDPPPVDRIGQAAPFDLLMRAYRCSMLHGSAPLLSLQRSSVIPTNYQLVPVVMALEQEPVRLLIADDVGLGKTIEAGLVATELIARQRARRVLVVTPANLREQWQEALERFFHLDANIISEQHRRLLERSLPPGANPWEHFPVLITSIDYAKQPAISYAILEQRWDLVIVDEAHNAARPHRGSREAPAADMRRWEFAQELAGRAHHLLMLTATPHNGYTDAFASLLEMLGIDAVLGEVPDVTIVRERARPHVVQRRRRDVEEWFVREGQKSPFPQRDDPKDQEVHVSLNAVERNAIAAVERLGTFVLDNVQTGRRAATLARWMVLHLHRRALSSPAALRQSLLNRRDSVRRLVAKATGSLDEPAIEEQDARSTVQDQELQFLTEEEASVRLDRAPTTKAEALQQELQLLNEAWEKAKDWVPARDSKLIRLRSAVLPDLLAKSPRVIIFTRYKDTLDYLADQIKAASDFDVFTLHGDLSEGERREEFGRFERCKRGVLIATDVISEGVNLQHACAQVAHYELPWNPNRLEQRNGRVDRYGQREPIVRIRTMVTNAALDALILKHLIEKAARIRQEFGFAPPFFGSETEILDLIRRQGWVPELPEGTQLRLFGSTERQKPMEVHPGDDFDPVSEETARRVQSESFYGQTEIELPDVQRRLEATHAAIGTPEGLKSFIRSGLAAFGCSISENGDGYETVRISLQNPALRVTGAEVIPRAAFDARAGVEDPDVEVIDLGHPLTRRIIQLVREQAFLPGDLYGRTTYRRVAGLREVTGVLHVLARFVVETSPRTIVEELVQVGVPAYGGQALDEGAVETLLSAAPGPGTVPESDVCEALREVQGQQGLAPAIDAAVERRRTELLAERTALRDKLSQRDDSADAWWRGLDRISVASRDILGIAVYFPT